MSKKTGSFFKSVLSKGKNFFKKNDKTPDNNQGDGSSDEDNDIIEVGKSGQKMPSSSLLSNLGDLAGSTLQKAD